MKVSNPLTIIAIFAGLAETLATVALIQLPLEIQYVFVYFVMAFPAIIVLLFFLVLYFKNTALYAPSDFDNQNHYLEANKLKEKLDEKVEAIFKSMNDRGARLTQEQIDYAKATLAKTLTRETLPASLLEILEVIANKPMSIPEISEKTGLMHSSTKAYLSRLKEFGFVNKLDNGFWEART